MPPRRGRPPKKDKGAPLDGTPPFSQTSQAFQYLYKSDTSTVECVLCHDAVKSIEEHLKQRHPTVLYEEYKQAHPGAKLYGEEDLSERKTITVTEFEVGEHPCGRDGVLIEKVLAEEERPHFRADIESLLSNGYEPSYEVASLAHLMTLARRARISIEAVREETRGQLYASEQLDLLHELEEKIAKGRQALERLRSSRVKENIANPHELLESEMAAAELWVQEHIGEHQERCPGCGQMLIAPALPHWAFEQSKDEHGNVYWPVWSPELWQMVLDRTIPLWVMAYTLRTSPEGLRQTAARRREEWASWIDVEWEEEQLRKRLIKDDRTHVLGKGETNGRT